MVSLWFTTEFQSLLATYKQYYDAVISYKLGRDTLEVEERDDLEKYRFIICCGHVTWLDKLLAILASSAGTMTFLMAYPGIVILGILQWLIGECILKYTSRTTLGAQSSISEADANQELSAVTRGPSRMCGILDLFPMHRRLPLSEDEKIEAYRTVCENCVGKDSGIHYECSVNVGESGSRKFHKCVRQNGLPFKVDEEVGEIFRNHRQMIKLPLLLNNTGPSRLSYLLQELAVTMKKPFKSEASGMTPKEKVTLRCPRSWPYVDGIRIISDTIISDTVGSNNIHDHQFLELEF